MKYKVNDKVTFTRVTSSGNRMQFKTLSGTIHRLYPERDGVVIKYHGGRYHETTTDKIRPEGAMTEISEMFLKRKGAE